MDKQLRTLLERVYGLPCGVSDHDAQEFYAKLSIEAKSRIGYELADAEIRKTRLPAGFDSLTTRESPTTATRDLTVRNFTVRAESVNDEERSVEAIIATDDTVTVFDYRLWCLIDEVLRMEGAEKTDQVSMLANHSRWSLNDVLGSAREIVTAEHDVKGRLYFAEGDEDAERAWQKVRGGHLRDVSAGYRAIKYKDIPPGQTAVVGGKSYTARGRTLRVTTRWQLKEVSLVPIGADARSKIRTDQPREDYSMFPKLRAYLESVGLRTEATDEEGATFLAGLKGEQRQQAELLQTNESQRNDPAPNPSSNPDSSRAATPPPPLPPVNVADAVRQAVTAERAAERERVRQIRELAGTDVPAEICARAIDEGWSLDRASQEFLTAVRESRQADATVPYTHTASTAPIGNANARALAAGLMLQTGIGDPTTCAMHNGRRDPTPADHLTAQDAEQGHRYQRMSAIDIVRECVRLDTGRMCWDPSEALEMARSAPSGGTLAYVFTTSMYARLMAGWNEVPDTTDWCDVEDVPNFLTQEDISLSADARLKSLPRGGTAKDATMADARETYRIARYARKFVVDEQDIIDDRLGSIMRMPQEMGAAARRVRPDLVYALLLANASLADTGALFNATAVTTTGGHKNLTTAVLAAAAIKAAILAMGKYREADGTALNIKPRYLIVPSALQWTSKELLTSTAQAYTAAAAAATPELYYPINIIAGENISLRVDDRIGAAGVVDPTTNTARTGLDTNWFLSAGGPRTVRVAYRRGTNRQPVMRSFQLDGGQWGIGWDINLDIGAKALDYRGLHKSTGAG